MDDKTRAENRILVLIICLSFAFLLFAYITNEDLTVRVQIITAVIAILGIAVNWRFGSSKSSANKDETIKSLQAAQSQQPTVVADTVQTDNVETINTNTTNVSNS